MLSASRVCHIAPRKGKRYLQRPQEAPGDHVLVPHRLTRQRRQQWLHSLCVVRGSLKPQTVPEKKLEMSWEDRISENSLNCIMYMNPQLGMCKSWNMWCLRLCPVQWLIFETLEHTKEVSGSLYPREDIHTFKSWVCEVENIFLTNLRNFDLSYFSLHSPQ